MKRWAASLAVSLLLTVAALGGAIEDGNAGLDALNNGDFDKAIALFSRVLKSGQLAAGDREFAYLNRGKAYMGKHDYAHAVVDLKMALKLDPSDADAKDALAEAQASLPGKGGEATPARGHGWGVLATLAGRHFWLQAPDQDPHKTLVTFDWLTPQQVLRYTITTKHDTIAVGLYRMDSSGVIVEAEAFPSGVYYGTAQATRDGETENFFANGIVARTLSTGSGSSFARVTQRYVNGAWQDLAQDQMVEASDAEIDAAGFKKR